MNKIKTQLTQLLIVLMLFALSGCQVLGDLNRNKVESKSDMVNFSQYYLWIKSLNNDEIEKEIIEKKSNKESENSQTDVQLIMLYSLPTSPIHNPYTAKKLLNDYPLAPYVEITFSDTNLAFIVMLKDQLNQQLLLLEQLTNYKGAYKQSKKINAAQEIKINQLNKQIIQLKKIEKTLSKRGQ